MKKNTEGWGENSIIDQKVQSQVEREKSNPMTWGTMPNDMKELITIANRVKMDPRAVLKRFARSVLSTNPFFTRRKPSKKDPTQDWVGYIPGKTYEQQAKVLFAVDTSGSMREEQIAKAIAFFMSALSQADVYFCWWDAKCGTIHRLKKKQPEMAIVGGGGTVPNCVIEKVRNERLKFDGIVFITDCYFEFQNPLGKEKIFIMKTDDAGQVPDWCKWVLSFKDIERC
jgi:predicted metal-dependent peptidase